jgi:hypothetical protein
MIVLLNLNSPVDCFPAMIGANQQLITVQMNRLSLRNNRLKLETAGELPIVLEEPIEYDPI